MNQPPGPDKPDQDGEDLRRLYQAAARPEPPELMDARLRKAARKAIAARRFKAPLIGDWKMPAAVAAVALLGFSLLLQVDDQEISIEALEGEREVLHTRQAEEARRKTQAQEQKVMERRLREKAAREEIEANAKRESMRQDRSLSDTVAPLEAPALSAQPEAEAPAMRELKEEVLLKRESRIEGKAYEGDELGVAPGSPQEQAEDFGEADVQSLKVEKPLASKERLAPAQEPAPPPIPDDPQQWLEKIRAQLERGEREAAIESLKRFKALHPDYPLEDDLSALLKNPGP